MKINAALITNILITTTLLSGTILASTLVSADNDSVVDEINITVPESCSISGTGMNTHNAEINNGQYNSAIGETTLKAFCNDNNGFAIYAIGYTDNEDGKNVLTSPTLGSTYDIVTGTAISGDTSNWAMKLSTITSPTPTYPIIIAGSSDDAEKEQGDPDYSTFQQVPDDYEKVAYRTSATDTGTNAEGTTLTTTYQAYISKTQPAGTYTGQVKYTLVHPHDATKPIKPVTIATAEYLQEVNACPADLVTGQVYTLIDSRDNEQYKVAKLADGKCWMLDNLRLDPTDTTTAANMSKNNTNAPEAAITNYLNGGNPDDIMGWSSVPVANNTSGNTSADKPMINNSKRDVMVTSYGLAANNGQAKAGIYYSACAATVGTFCYSGSTYDVPDTYIDAPHDLCPTGWRMPTGYYNDSEYYNLYQHYNTTQNASNPNSVQYNLSVPLAGYYNGTIDDWGISGLLMASTTISNSGISSSPILANIVVTSSIVYAMGAPTVNSYVPLRCLVK